MPHHSESVLLHGGPIHTMGRELAVEALLIIGGRVAACGSLREVSAQAPAGTRRLDLQGRTAIPGLVDTHPHLLHFAARTAALVNLADAIDHDDICARIAARVAQLQPGEWVHTTPVGEANYFIRRSYFDLEERRLPDRWTLDRVSSDNPVWIQAWTPREPNICVFNSQALSLLGISALTPDRVCDVWIDKDPAGVPTGILRGSVNTMFNNDPFWNQILARIPSLQLHPMATTRGAMRDYNALGVTTVYEAHGMAPSHVEVYGKLHAAGELTTRVLATVEIENYAVAPYKPLTDPQFDASLEVALKLQTEGDEFFRVSGATLSDGGPCWSGFWRAYEPYKDGYGRPTKGMQFISDAKRRRFVSYCAEHGLRGNLCCGAPPDEDGFLSLIEGSERRDVIRERRWIVQHAAVITGKQARRFRELGFDVTTSMSFPWGLGDMYGERVGRHVWRDLTPLKRLLDTGLNVACGTDWGPKNIFEHLQLAETHEFAQSGHRNDGPDHKVDRRTALEMWTRRAGEILDWIPVGHLEPGALGDVAILDRDILACPLENLPSTVVLETLLGGRSVYRRDPEVTKEQHD